MKLDIKIYGVKKRKKWIESYKKQLPITDNDIIYDDRPNGGNAYYTCKKAWLQPIPNGVTHRLCLPDDVQLTKNFLKILNKIIKTHPDKVICLFPYDYCFMMDFVDINKTPYYNVHVMSCCGVVYPVQYIKDCFDWIDKNFEDQDKIIDDVAMQKYYNENNIPYITTIPAILQHIGDESLVTPNSPIRKTNYFIDDMKDINPNWETTDIIVTKRPKIKFSNTFEVANKKFKKRYNVKYRL